MLPLFSSSRTTFQFEGISQPFRDWPCWNSLVTLISLMREGLYHTYDAYLVFCAFEFSSALGVVFLKRYSRDLLNR